MGQHYLSFQIKGDQERKILNVIARFLTASLSANMIYLCFIMCSKGYFEQLVQSIRNHQGGINPGSDDMMFTSLYQSTLLLYIIYVSCLVIGGTCGFYAAITFTTQGAYLCMLTWMIIILSQFIEVLFLVLARAHMDIMVNTFVFSYITKQIMVDVSILVLLETLFILEIAIYLAIQESCIRHEVSTALLEGGYLSLLDEKEDKVEQIPNAIVHAECRGMLLA